MPADRGRIRLTIGTIALFVLQSAAASAVQGQVVRGRLVDDGDKPRCVFVGGRANAV